MNTAQPLLQAEHAGPQEDWWQLKDNARLPSEAELRRSITPDQWCAFDSMKAGLHRLFEIGSIKTAKMVEIAERMQIAIEQLPEVSSTAVGFFVDKCI